MATHVFVIGAGASAAAGAPVMANFLDEAERIFSGGNLPPDLIRAFANVFRGLHWLSLTSHKIYTDQDNLESVYATFEMCKLLSEPKAVTNLDPDRLPQDLASVIAETLAQKVRHPLPGGRQPDGYQQLSAYIERLRRLGEDIGILTFNYDLCIEAMLDTLSAPYDYGLSGRLNAGIPVLKLHGSINWTTEADKTIQPIGFRDLIGSHAAQQAYADPDKYVTVSPRKYFEGRRMEYDPFIIPPSLAKIARQSEISQIWKHAAKMLSRAESISFIGYSLPASDQFFNSLLAIGSVGSTRIKYIDIYNIDKSGATEDRYRRMFGAQLQKRITYWPYSFDDAYSKNSLLFRNRITGG